MNFVIPLLVGAFLMSSFIGLVAAIIESFQRHNAWREFDWLNPGDAARLLSFLSFVVLIVCMGIAGGTQ